MLKINLQNYKGFLFIAAILACIGSFSLNFTEEGNLLLIYVPLGLLSAFGIFVSLIVNPDIQKKQSKYLINKWDKHKKDLNEGLKNISQILENITLDTNFIFVQEQAEKISEIASEMSDYQKTLREHVMNCFFLLVSSLAIALIGFFYPVANLFGLNIIFVNISAIFLILGFYFFLSVLIEWQELLSEVN